MLTNADVHTHTGNVFSGSTPGGRDNAGCYPPRAQVVPETSTLNHSTLSTISGTLLLLEVVPQEGGRALLLEHRQVLSRVP
jgi:hypothetical protein